MARNTKRTVIRTQGKNSPTRGPNPADPYPHINLMPPIKEGVLQVAPNVSFIRPELSANFDKYDLIRDCLAGQEAVKKRGDKYLPRPNPEDTSDENQARYSNYLKRALFYNVVRNTNAGLVGQVFAADPVSEFPKELDPLWYDCTGTGVSMIQQAKRTLSHVLAFGRAGLLTDFPRAKEDGSAFTREEVQQGYARPTIQFYNATDIINWRYKMVGAKSVLSLIVINEEYTLRDDGFEIVTGNGKRVLRLVEMDGKDVYTMEEWRPIDPENPDGDWSQHGETVIPTDNSGQPLSYIPFTFVGSQNNDSSVDNPPMYDLACINIAHYRNSADYEDSVYMVGQPTPYFAGLSQQWVDEVLKGEVQLGSRAAVPLPEGGSAGLIQANENSMVKEAMEIKHRQMVAIGAQLVEDKQTQRTLGEAKMEAASVSSVLSSCARNVSQAFEHCVRWACAFYGIEPGVDEIVFALSTDFAIMKMSTEERRVLMEEWQGGGISWSEYRNALRQSGVAILDDEEAKEEIEGDQQRQIDLDKENGLGPDGKPIKTAEEEEEEEEEGAE